ncbi:phosphatidylinositol mannoside acyltransferase [Ornithinimicrobium sp. Arc0846-15]|nr:phosphatidylinositol mannoside acyltransferase [Ornithinimicrobium laminariae]
MSSASERLSLLAFRAGWKLVRVAPERLAYGAFDLGARITTRRNGRDVQRMRGNYARVHPDISADDLERMVADGIASYLRYWCDAFRLADRSPADLAKRVRTVNDEPVRESLAAGDGHIIFLGHLGNWDTAGGWATSHMAPVTTVAERLKPEELFQEFVAFREALGMTIYPLTGTEGVFRELISTIKAGGFVPLLADRDLTDGGVRVDFLGGIASMAAGPAALAVATGAPLRAASVHYELRDDLKPGPAAYRIVISFGPLVPDPGEGTKAERIQAMTQQCADFIGAAVREHTHDWHMMQRVFVEDPA